jgi:hypothetical protein
VVVYFTAKDNKVHHKVTQSKKSGGYVNNPSRHLRVLRGKNISPPAQTASYIALFNNLEITINFLIKYLPFVLF